jgi:DnaK suppressor protein
VTDILDEAKKLEIRHRQAALDNALKRTEPTQQTLDGRVICISCDAPISLDRLAAKPNAARCIHCQQIEEQKHGR